MVVVGMAVVTATRAVSYQVLTIVFLSMAVAGVAYTLGAIGRASARADQANENWFRRLMVLQSADSKSLKRSSVSVEDPKPPADESDTGRVAGRQGSSLIDLRA